MEKKCIKATKEKRILVTHPSLYYNDTTDLRKHSTETLKRLTLVSQRLKQEVENKYWSEMYGDRILFIIRLGSMILMLLIIGLIVTGKGSISLNNNEKETIYIWLSFEKWLSPEDYNLPEKFVNLNVGWQYLCVLSIIIILILQVYFTYLHLKKIQHCLRVCKLIHSGCCFTLFFLFFVEGFFSFCPWINFNFESVKIVNEIPGDNHFQDTSCSIGGWFLAAQLLLAVSLLMCFEFFIILNIGSTDIHWNDRRLVNIKFQGTTV
uniref:Transmembrane channel-like protein n=1 Tax=Strongyloides stercoralis TaxID=6248 RepID=A0A0K0E029_STRER